MCLLVVAILVQTVEAPVQAQASYKNVVKGGNAEFNTRFDQCGKTQKSDFRVKHGTINTALGLDQLLLVLKPSQLRALVFQTHEILLDDRTLERDRGVHVTTRHGSKHIDVGSSIGTQFLNPLVNVDHLHLNFIDV